MATFNGFYKATADFPKDEKFGLISQMRRCAISDPSNISEGAGRDTKPQLMHFLIIAVGPCNEIITQLGLAFRLGFLPVESKEQLIDEATQIYKMILAFYNLLNKS